MGLFNRNNFDIEREVSDTEQEINDYLRNRQQNNNHNPLSQNNYYNQNNYNQQGQNNYYNQNNYNPQNQNNYNQNNYNSPNQNIQSNNNSTNGTNRSRCVVYSGDIHAVGPVIWFIVSMIVAFVFVPGRPYLFPIMFGQMIISFGFMGMSSEKEIMRKTKNTPFIFLGLICVIIGIKMTISYMLCGNISEATTIKVSFDPILIIVLLYIGSYQTTVGAVKMYLAKRICTTAVYATIIDYKVPDSTRDGLPQKLVYSYIYNNTTYAQVGDNFIYPPWSKRKHWNITSFFNLNYNKEIGENVKIKINPKYPKDITDDTSIPDSIVRLVIGGILLVIGFILVFI